ncbi:helix-turn-helix domain-containing protein [Cohnella zeiphila]|uniref:Response regulator n=1 Tax=Cohnella zeiphila TaxID=2761120 RepID=A0A7X0STY5_9BACL|nr:helix-turn-helix domain-containing protein [Cohnella zeiphila]MBB6735941.1 response regulator [Cohnella zeiphila]
MRLLIVDDDARIRDGLAKAIEWKKHGLTLLPPAASAEEALARFAEERPDIVLTDIEMTGMTGLEMASRIKRGYPRTEIVVLSGYDQFAYMQRAIREGVSDYILKTSGPDEIVRVALNARRRLLGKEGPGASSAGPEQLLRSGALEDLLFHGLSPERIAKEELEKLFPEEDSLPGSGGRRLQVVIVSLRQPGVRMSAGFSHFTIRSRLRERFAAVTLRYGKRTLAVLNGRGEEAARALRETLAELEAQLGCRLFVAAGCAVDRPEALADSLREAEAASRYEWLMAESGFAAYEEVRERRGIDPACSKEEELALVQVLKSGNAAELREMANRLCERIRSDPEATPESLHAYVQALLTAGYRWLENTASRTGRQAPRGRMRLPAPEELLAGPERTLTERLEAIMNEYLELGSEEHPYIAEAVAYVKENLGRNVTLQQVASHIHTNPNYLSDLFRRETGSTYLEFVTKERMEKAKAMLAGTGAKIKEIARSVGYEDIKYFTGLFKRHTGLTPSEYRSHY